VGDTDEPEDDDIPGEWRTIMYFGYSPVWETQASQRMTIYLELRAKMYFGYSSLWETQAGHGFKIYVK
jgi:hypothetical protein